MEKSNLTYFTLAFLLGGLLMFALTYRETPYHGPPRVPLARAAESRDEPYERALEVQSAFRRVSAELSASVVEIAVESESLIEDNEFEEMPWNDFFTDPSEEPKGLQFYRSKGMGSGVIVERDDDSYYIVTNSHVIGKAKSIDVRLFGGELLTGHLVGKDDRKDLALLRVDSPGSPLPVAEFGDSDTLYVGDWVLAIGSPFGYENSVTSGVVSALDRPYAPHGNINSFIQTDASINQGNSGGPLVNIHGDIIGINTFITTPNSGSIGLGFAIPANNVKSFVQRLLDYGNPHYGWLGVSLGAYTAQSAEALGYPPNYGVMVYQVYRGSPAEEGGLLPGDLILSMNGERFFEEKKLIYQIGDISPGDTAIFSIDRFGRRLEIQALIRERKPEEEVHAMHSLAWPGFVPAPLTDEVRNIMELPETVNGVPVAVVYPHSPAQASDLRAGDVITGVGGMAVDSVSGLYLALGEINQEGLEFSVYRNGENITLTRGKGKDHE